MAQKGKGKGKGGNGILLLALLLIMVAGGGWNYHRNLTLEKQQEAQRPFLRYTDADLDSLAQAYRQDIENLERQYKSALDSRTGARDRGLLGERINEYERVRRSNDQLRDATAAVGQREARLAEISAEQRQRGKGSGLMLHLERLTKI